MELILFNNLVGLLDLRKLDLSEVLGSENVWFMSKKTRLIGACKIAHIDDCHHSGSLMVTKGCSVVTVVLLVALVPLFYIN